MKTTTFLTLLASANAQHHGPWSKGPWSHGNSNPLIVETDSGTYRGLINGSAPLVREFVGIPFAQPPKDDLRWLPPQKLHSNASHVYDATQYPPSCAQYISQVPTVFNTVTPEYSIAGPISEDCLALSVWTPMHAEKLPVIMFITGGGFQTGGVEINYQLPYNWVQRTQAHIVVTINYRLNIFGFPNAAGLDDQNLGILDQRMALEWVRDNIEAFGGDPSRITLWGQSAGAASVDINNFAFYDDPIVTGFFPQSGTAFLLSSDDEMNSNFTFVASHVGCHYPNDAAKELSCMRKVPWEDIEAFVGGYADNGTEPALNFNPVPDEKIVFSDYPQRYRENKVSQRPAIFSNTEEEGNSLVPFKRSGINETAAREVTLSAFICPAAQTAKLRTQAGLTTYRYEYSGVFDNTAPLPWMGPYHASDLPMMFATHQDYTNGEGQSTSFEYAVSERMEDLVYAFMLDPEQGPQKQGWPPYTSGQMLRFGADGKVMQTVSVDSVEGDCSSAS
ncbi:uncharacterized protein LTR77_008917 [Saxophila tyrrhenica]|uniref:Carboxylic ester hydrolase n=1 Tax=Saxophila tyrrhenica TaxID=1690608 RepID=A0AAV9NZ04_9PEZI|nr:hypothetical protein LTR77_008917 [Saxophila tyrrhenica]